MRLIEPNKLGSLSEGPTDETGGGAERTVSAWLDVLVRLLRLPQPAQDEIRQELQGHLSERIRDLILAGHTEDQATRTAIGELGEASDLAQRYKDANQFAKRRLVMNLTLLTACLGVAGIGVVTLTGSDDQIKASIFQAPEPSGLAAESLEAKIDVAFNQTPLEDVLDFLGQQIERPLYVHWSDLEDQGLYREEMELTLNVSGLSLKRTMELVLDQINDYVDSAEWCFSEDLVELGTRSEFARRDTVLVSYDITNVLVSMSRRFDLEYADASEQVVDLLTNFVEPCDWVNNGGDLAQVRIVGAKMFIQAPRPMHRQITWIIAELQSGESDVASRGAIGFGGHGGKGGAGGAGGSGGGAGGAGGAGGGGGGGGGFGGAAGGAGGKATHFGPTDTDGFGGGGQIGRFGPAKPDPTNPDRVGVSGGSASGSGGTKNHPIERK